MLKIDTFSDRKSDTDRLMRERERERERERDLTK